MKNKLARSSLAITFFTLLGGIFNYLSIAVLAFTFGTRMEMDAYFAATTLPQLIVTILGTALPNSFIPFFIGLKVKDENRAWKTANNTLNWLFLILLVMALLAGWFANGLILLLNPGLKKQTADLAVSLFRILFPAIVFSGSATVLTSMQYSEHRFFVPSLVQGLVGLVTLLFVVFGRSLFGIHSIAIGNLVGCILQFGLLTGIVFKGGRYSWRLDPKEKELFKLGRNLSPLLMGAVFTRANPMVERFIASRLEEGAISYLGFAYKIVFALLLFIGPGIATAIFPRMSEYAAQKDFAGLREIFSKGFRALLLIAMPLVFFIIFSRYDLVKLFFQRGGFSAADTRAVADVLLAYLGYLAVGAVGSPIVNIFYSLQETLKVTILGISGFILYTVLAFVFAGFWSYVGVALAISLQYVISLFVYSHLTTKKIGRLTDAAILRCLGKVVLSSAMMVLFFLAVKSLLSLWLVFPFDFLISGGLAFFIYLLVLAFLKTEELRFIPFKIFPFPGNS